MLSYLIKDVVEKKLSDIKFQRKTIPKKPLVSNTFKSRILDGTNLEVDFLNDNEFLITISADDYYSIVSTDFYYSYQKVVSQRDQLNDKTISSFSIPWAAVTSYYSSFYASIEISRLYGMYNMYLTDEHCRDISRFVSSDFSIKKGVYIGLVSLNTKGYIELKFSKKENSEPHKFAWINIIDIIKGISPPNGECLKVIQEIKRNCHAQGSVGLPSAVRNDWNYSIVNAYDQEYCSDVAVFRDYFYKRNYKDAFKLLLGLNAHTVKLNRLLYIVYFERVLFDVMENLRIKLVEHEI